MDIEGEQTRSQHSAAAFERHQGTDFKCVQPEDVSKMVAFLVSDDARYVTGVEHRVDAGFMIK